MSERRVGWVWRRSEDSGRGRQNVVGRGLGVVAPLSECSSMAGVPTDDT